MIRIGDRIEIEPGSKTSETQIRFDQKSIGRIQNLTISLDAENLTPILDLTIADVGTTERPTDFLIEMVRNGFAVKIKRLEDFLGAKTSNAVV